MSGTARLTLVSHAMTDAMSAGRFPLDEPLSDLGLQIPPIARVEYALCGPEVRTRQTAELLGLTPEIAAPLGDLDCGDWAGQSLDRVAPDQLAAWLSDPQAAPHGGESIIDLLARVRDWLAGLPSARIVAVTHPAIVRAAIMVALDAPPNSFWRIDVEPLTRTVLHRRPGGWTLRCR